MIALALALQAATPRSAPDATPATPAPTPVETRADGSQRWSIMSCPTRAAAGEIVVCGRRDELPEEPMAGRGANRDLSAKRALDLASAPCAARMGGCQVGINILGPPTMLVRVIQKLVNPKSDCCEGDDATNPLSLVRDVATGVRHGLAAKPDKSHRIPIPLDDPALPADAKLEPGPEPAATPQVP